MKKVIFPLICCLLAICTNVQANADVKYSIQKKSNTQNVYQLLVKATFADDGMSLESFPGNTLSQFRVTVKVPSVNTMQLGSTKSSYSGLSNLESTVVNYGSYDYISFFANPNVSIDLSRDGEEIVLLEFSMDGNEKPVLWNNEIDPAQVGSILIYNAYFALPNNSDGDKNNYVGNFDHDFESVYTDDFMELQNIQIYPNPAASSTTVSGVLSETSYNITAKNGGLVKQGKLAIGKNIISLQDFVPGVYYMVIQGENETRNLPFVVLK